MKPGNAPGGILELPTLPARMDIYDLADDQVKNLPVKGWTVRVIEAAEFPYKGVERVVKVREGLWLAAQPDVDSASAWLNLGVKP